MYIFRNVKCIVLCRAGVTWYAFLPCSVRVRSGWFKLYEWTLYYMNYEPCEMKCHIHCVQLHALLYMCIKYDPPPQFDRVKGHIRNSSANSMLLLTSSTHVQSFIILRRRVHEVSWERTDGHKRRSHSVLGNT